MEATAQFDFNARSSRELSLRKGDHVLLRKQVSNDWWQGTVRGKDGLIPDKYISLKIKYVDVLAQKNPFQQYTNSFPLFFSIQRRRP